MAKLPLTNFAHLAQHDEQLLRLGLLAEKYFAEDPNTCLLKLRQLSEVLAQLVAARTGQLVAPEETQYDLLRRLQDSGVVPREVAQLFGEIRRTGNAASHALEGDYRGALSGLKITWQLSLWFHRTFNEPSFKSGPFVPPAPPQNESDELRAEMGRLSLALQEYQTTHQETAGQLEATEAKLRQSKNEQAFWEQMAADAEQAKAALEKRLAEQQTVATAQPKRTLVQFVTAANTAASAVQLDEADTRKLIDQQLRQAGWEADSQNIKYNKGARPEKGRNLAIAEWPTESGPADYVLFAGLMPIAVVEAKRKNIEVSGSLQQAKRYSRTFTPSQETMLPDENWGGDAAAYRVPFAFSSNGRPFLRQLATKSGIWFCDLRRADNLGHVLDGWYTPEGLTTLLKRDEAKAHEDLANAPFNYGFPLRYYQQDAIRAAELAIEAGQREMLLAMATGTGKTKTCIALIYRLLKAKRFRRILFLVDRSALGEQAANAFKDTRMENLQTFANTFGINELEDSSPDSDTAVHIATIQGMVQRLLYATEDSPPLAVDQYDCIVVDECHRGYLLDRELSDTEMTFRGYEDYISKYRRVLDYFDAYKVGLTATPALHTTQIFGAPVYTYSYREAVIDGYLVDYEPPVQIKTELSTHGIKWKAGENIKVFDGRYNQIELFKTPDEIKMDVEDFNRKVITVPFNRVVCEYLAQELDPASRRKTLIYCVTDAHADMVVDLLKKAFEARYGSVDDDAVIKITGAADKPLSLIRRYKNERNPNVAVTVDLLTTGIDVPEICNLVFLRRVNSRILFDQMLGRATRLCDEIEKESFRVFDAVQIFAALGDMTAMQPVVVNPKITFVQLTQELVTVGDETARQLVRDQFLAKLQSKKRHLSEKSACDFETKAGMMPDEFIKKLKAMNLNEVAAWFTQNPDLGEILDRKGDGASVPLFISEHEDKFHSAEHGYGRAQKPADYLKEFTAFIKSHSNDIPALMNLMLHGIDGGISYGDTLSPEGQALPKATLTLTNPPFGTKKGGGLPSRTDFTFPTSNKQFAFLQHIYRGLKAGGRAAVVLPDNVLFESNVGTDIRRDLMDKCNLHTILRLPTGIFYAQGVKTNVLFFTRGEKEKGNTKEVWVYDLRANMPQFGKRTQLTREHFADFEAFFGDDPQGDNTQYRHSRESGNPEVARFRAFSREQIAERGDSLDIAWLKDDNDTNADDLPEPAVLVQEAMSELEAALDELRGILEELGEEIEEVGA